MWHADDSTKSEPALSPERTKKQLKVWEKDEKEKKKFWKRLCVRERMRHDLASLKEVADLWNNRAASSTLEPNKGQQAWSLFSAFLASICPFTMWSSIVAFCVRALLPSSPLRFGYRKGRHRRCCVKTTSRSGIGYASSFCCFAC